MRSLWASTYHQWEVKWHSHFRTQSGSSLWRWTLTCPMTQSFSTCVFTRRNENFCPYKHLCSYGLSSIVHYGQRMEAAQMPALPSWATQMTELHPGSGDMGAPGRQWSRASKLYSCAQLGRPRGPDIQALLSGLVSVISTFFARVCSQIFKYPPVSIYELTFLIQITPGAWMWSTVYSNK